MSEKGQTTPATIYPLAQEDVKNGNLSFVNPRHEQLMMNPKETVCAMLEMLTIDDEIGSKKHETKEGKDDSSVECYPERNAKSMKKEMESKKKMILLTLASSPESCLALRRAGCIPLLVQILHPPVILPFTLPDSDEVSQLPSGVKRRAHKALKNIVNYNPDEKIKRRENRVLKLLESLDPFIQCARELSESRRSTSCSRLSVSSDGNISDGKSDSSATGRSNSNAIYTSNESSTASSTDFTGGDCNGKVYKNNGVPHPIQTVTCIMKLSFDEDHKETICLLGGVNTLAEVLLADEILHPSRPPDKSFHEEGVPSMSSNCILLRGKVLMALTNLTFRNKINKSLLCSLPSFLDLLSYQVSIPDEDLVHVTASVLRNLSWKADTECRIYLRNAYISKTLMGAVMKVKKDQTLKTSLNALWNLSAHNSSCEDSDKQKMVPNNKIQILEASPEALEHLIKLFKQECSIKITNKKYKNGNSGDAQQNAAVSVFQESACGILHNICSEICHSSNLRKRCREAGLLENILYCLGKQTTSDTVISNSCGILYYLCCSRSESEDLTVEIHSDFRRLVKLGAIKTLENIASYSKISKVSSSANGALMELMKFNSEYCGLNLVSGHRIIQPPVAHIGSLSSNLWKRQKCPDGSKLMSKQTYAEDVGIDLSIRPRTQAHMQKFGDRDEPLDLSMSSSRSFEKQEHRPNAAIKSSIPTSASFQHKISCSEILPSSGSSQNHQMMKNLSPDNHGIDLQPDQETPFDYALQFQEVSGNKDEGRSEELVDDTTKTYCDEGTPRIFSHASSCIDLRCPSVIPTTNKPVIEGLIEDSPRTYFVENTPAEFSRRSSLSSINDENDSNPEPLIHAGGENTAELPNAKKPKLPTSSAALNGKNVLPVLSAEMTPLMFSRSSSVASLESLDRQAESNDHRKNDAIEENNEDFRSETSSLREVVSPSDLPDSPRALDIKECNGNHREENIDLSLTRTKASNELSDTDSVRVFGTEEKSGFVSRRSLSPLVVDGEEIGVLTNSKNSKKSKSEESPGNVICHSNTANGRSASQSTGHYLDEVKVFAMEGTPFNALSSATSLSDLMGEIDREEQASGRYANPKNKVHVEEEDVTNSDVKKLVSAKPKDPEIDKLEGLCEDDSKYGDSQLLQKCIQLGKSRSIMPKSRSEMTFVPKDSCKEGKKETKIGSMTSSKSINSEDLSSSSTFIEKFEDPDLAALILKGKTLGSGNQKNAGHQSKKRSKVGIKHDLQDPTGKCKSKDTEIENNKKVSEKQEDVEPPATGLESPAKQVGKRVAAPPTPPKPKILQKVSENALTEVEDSSNSQHKDEMTSSQCSIEASTISNTTWAQETSTFSCTSLSISGALKLVDNLEESSLSVPKRPSRKSSLVTDSIKASNDKVIECSMISSKQLTSSAYLENIEQPSILSNVVSSSDCALKKPSCGKVSQISSSQSPNLSEKVNRQYRKLLETSIMCNSNVSNLQDQKPPAEFCAIDDLESSMASIKSDEIFDNTDNSLGETYTIFPPNPPITSEHQDDLFDKSNGNCTVIRNGKEEDATDVEEDIDDEVAETNDGEDYWKSDKKPPIPIAPIKPMVGADLTDSAKVDTNVPVLDKFATFVKKKHEPPKLSPLQKRKQNPGRFLTRTIAKIGFSATKESRGKKDKISDGYSTDDSISNSKIDKHPNQDMNTFVKRNNDSKSKFERNSQAYSSLPAQSSKTRFGAKPSNYAPVLPVRGTRASELRKSHSRETSPNRGSAAQPLSTNFSNSGRAKVSGTKSTDNSPKLSRSSQITPKSSKPPVPIRTTPCLPHSSSFGFFCSSNGRANNLPNKKGFPNSSSYDCLSETKNDNENQNISSGFNRSEDSSQTFLYGTLPKSKGNLNVSNSKIEKSGDTNQKDSFNKNSKNASASKRFVSLFTRSKATISNPSNNSNNNTPPRSSSNISNAKISNFFFSKYSKKDAFSDGSNHNKNLSSNQVSSTTKNIPLNKKDTTFNDEEKPGRFEAGSIADVDGVWVRRNCQQLLEEESYVQPRADENHCESPSLSNLSFVSNSTSNPASNHGEDEMSRGSLSSRLQLDDILPCGAGGSAKITSV